MLKGVCYVRVSTENQLENYSIEEQTQRLKAFCKAKDIAIQNIYTDGGYSGGSIHRPALQQMLKDIETAAIDVVIVYKLDRLSRSQKDTLMLIEDKFLAWHTDFISVCENFDTSSPFGRAMIGILSVFAQLEKEQITERFTMGRIGRAKNGYYHGGAFAPTGYDYIEGRLVVNEYEALQVRELYERFAAGYPLHNCRRYMSERYTTKYGSWTNETLVRNVLKNSVYIGKIKFKGEVYDGNHDPIITEELFYQVQRIFQSKEENGRRSGTAPFRASHLLTSFLYCGKCGARMHGEHGNYACYSRTKGDKRYIMDPNCKNKKWKISELDKLVTDTLTKLKLNASQPDSAKKGRQADAGHDYSKRIKEIDTQTARLIDLYQAGNIPLALIHDKILHLAKEKECLSSRSGSTAIEGISSIEYQGRFTALMNQGSLADKRACLSHLVSRIAVNDDSIRIILK